MNNLIKDLMKLDLEKFTKPRCNSNHRRGSASPNLGPHNNVTDSNNISSHQNMFSMRHNS